MRRIPLLLVLAAIASGCVDGLGIQTDCLSEMADARSDNGGPPDATQRDEDRGDFTEVWYFDDTRRKYTFRWGVSHDGCDVQRGSFNLLPAPGTG